MLDGRNTPVGHLHSYEIINFRLKTIPTIRTLGLYNKNHLNEKKFLQKQSFN